MKQEKSKPGRNWRVLLTELGIIVLGVSVALAAQQTVDWFNWRGQVAEARQTIATELSRNLVNAIARIRSVDCTARRLDALALILDAASRTSNLPPVGIIGLPPRALWPNGAWESVVASQTATHFPRPLLVGMAGVYKNLQRVEVNSIQEVDAWNALYPIVGPGRRLDPASEAELRKAISSARTFNHIMTSLSGQLVTAVRNLHLTFSREDLERIAQAQPQATLNICAPIGAVPPSYGQGSPKLYSAFMDDTMKSLRDLTKNGQ